MLIPEQVKLKLVLKHTKPENENITSIPHAPTPTKKGKKKQ